jgi:hypothetical protein
MAEIINLNRARKAKAAAEAEALASANRAKFGRTKADKMAEAARQELAAKTLDSHKRDDASDGEADD